MSCGVELEAACPSIDKGRRLDLLLLQLLAPVIVRRCDVLVFAPDVCRGRFDWLSSGTSRGAEGTIAVVAVQLTSSNFASLRAPPPPW